MGPLSELTTGEFDPYDEATVRDPHAVYAGLRSRCPVAHGSRWGGFWALTGYAEVVAASTAPHTFSSTSGVVIPINPLAGQRLPMHFDPPEHTAYRRMLNPAFSAEVVAGLAGSVTVIAERLLAPMLERGHGEFIAEFTSPLASHSLAAFLGMPAEFGDRLERHSVAFERAQDAGDPDAVAASNDVLYTYAREVLAGRRDAGPADLVGALIAGRVDGRALTDDEIVGSLRQVFIAGHIAVAAALGSVLGHLADDPSLQQHLRERPDLVPAAVEELLRLHTPNQGFARTVRDDTVVAAQRLRVGEQVALVYTAANRDPAVFPDPDTVDIHRQPNRHLAFGHGVHKCVGIDLARLELRAGVTALLTATREFVRSGPSQPLRWPIYGPATLPVRLTAS